MAKPHTGLRLASLGAATLSSAAIALQPAFVDAPVTAPMVLAAMDICSGQLRAGAFDEDALTRSGWVVAIRADGDPVIRSYRHPDNMILLSTFDSSNGTDKCSVMAPTGQGLSLSEMRSAIEQQTGGRPITQAHSAVWTLPDRSLALRSMGQVGVVIEIQPRNPDAHTR